MGPLNVPTLLGGYVDPAAGRNLLIDPTAFNLWAQGNATVAANVITAPDGRLTADKLNETAALASSHSVSKGTTKAATALPYAGSVHARAAERSWVVLTLFDGATLGIRAWFNLAAGVVGSSANIGAGFTAPAWRMVPTPNGFYRCELMAVSSTATEIQLFIYTSTGDGVLNFDGAAGSGIYLWNGILRQGA